MSGIAFPFEDNFDAVAIGLAFSVLSEAKRQH
jgi:hypothetical protein